MLTIATGGDTPKCEALLVIENNDHQWAQLQPGLYKGDIATTINKDGAFLVHIVPANADSKKYTKKIRSLLGKKLTRHFLNVANDNLTLGGSIGRTHHLAQLKPRRVKRIVKRLKASTVPQLRRVPAAS